jgi:hypothetical protein
MEKQLPFLRKRSGSFFSARSENGWVKPSFCPMVLAALRAVLYIAQCEALPFGGSGPTFRNKAG